MGHLEIQKVHLEAHLALRNIVETMTNTPPELTKKEKKTMCSGQRVFVCLYFTS